MPLAIALPFETGVGVVLVDSVPVQVGNPCFDVSFRHKESHSLTGVATLLAAFGGGILDLSYPCCDLTAIGVDHHNQRLFNPILPRPVVSQFLRKSCSNKLLA